ncbi:helix-turn-helix domain-containing protein [Rothia nasimurium]|uniref:helix-turn-helix domain-containing protein n=2 Tax=Rothia nasimurium TaxID=85336 RepID=UPI001F1A3D71|nr:helix-turn-helix transcriptional regulator [Rothia nasimurium]
MQHFSIYCLGMEKNDLNQQIGSRIESLRTKLGISRAEFARRMEEQPGLDKYNAMTVKRTEDGERSLRIEEIIGVAAVLGVTIDALISEDKDSYKENERLIELSRAVADYERLREELVSSVSGVYQAIKEMQRYFVELGQENERPSFKKAKIARAYEIANEERLWAVLLEGVDSGIRLHTFSQVMPDEHEIRNEIDHVLGVAPSTWSGQLPFEHEFYEYEQKIKQTIEEAQ